MHSLRADLPYAHNDPASALVVRAENAEDGFSRAFLAAQYIISMRTRLGWMWRLKELTHDLTAEHMKVVDGYIQPILEQAIKKNKEKRAAGIEKAEEDETLLDHLVKQTDGEAVSATRTSYRAHICIFHRPCCAPR